MGIFITVASILCLLNLREEKLYYVVVILISRMESRRNVLKGIGGTASLPILGSATGSATSGSPIRVVNVGFQHGQYKPSRPMKAQLDGDSLGRLHFGESVTSITHLDSPLLTVKDSKEQELLSTEPMVPDGGTIAITGGVNQTDDLVVFPIEKMDTRSPNEGRAVVRFCNLVSDEVSFEINIGEEDGDWISELEFASVSDEIIVPSSTSSLVVKSSVGDSSTFTIDIHEGDTYTALLSGNTRDGGLPFGIVWMNTLPSN